MSDDKKTTKAVKKAVLVARKGYVLAGGSEWKLAWFKSVTLERALQVHSNAPVNSIKKVWKIANTLTKPNYLEK